MILALSMYLLALIVFWFKGNSKDLYGLNWSPFEWWLYTSLFTNYLCITAWWKLVEIGDVWKAGIAVGICDVLVQIALNSYFYGFNPKGVIALALIILAGIISYS